MGKRAMLNEPAFEMWQGDPLNDQVIVVNAADGLPVELDSTWTVTAKAGTTARHLADLTVIIADQSVTAGGVAVEYSGSTMAWPVGLCGYQLCLSKDGVTQHQQIIPFTIKAVIP